MSAVRRQITKEGFAMDNLIYKDLADQVPVVELAGKIVKAKKRDSRTFAGILLGVRQKEIWPGNKNGVNLMVKRALVDEIIPIGGM